MSYKITKVYYTCIPEGADEHAVGKKLLAHGLKDLYQLNLEEEPIEKNEYGKPYLKNHDDVKFNISHSGEFVICAVGPSEVGIDIEQHREADYTRLAERAFLETECQEMAKLEDPKDYFFDHWTLTEAYLKWKGVGITTDLKALKFEGWGRNLPITDGYSAAVWSQRLLMMKIFFVDYQEL